MARVPARKQVDVQVAGQRRVAAGPVDIEVLDDTPTVANYTETVAPDGSLIINVGGQPDAEQSPIHDRFDANLAEGMDDNALSALASHLLDGIEADLQSRKDWEDTANKAADYLGIKLNDPSTSVSSDGTVCKSVTTVMLEASARLWGVARAELLPVSGPVKVRRDDVPPPKSPTPAGSMPGATNPAGAQPSDPAAGIVQPDAPAPDLDDLADALEKDLNWYLTVGDREYYPDFSKMLFHRAIVGNAFRKVYRCPLRRKPVSVWVKAQDLIVSNDCSHLSGAGRVTERIRYRQSIMKRLQVSGHYLQTALVQPTGQVTDTEIAVADAEGIVAQPQLPEDFEHMVYECYCEIGSGTTSSLMGDLSRLDKDDSGKRPGFPLPYRVSIDVDSRTVLEIRRNWKEGDEDYTPRRRYVKYGFLPGFGFYDFGLIHIVGNPTQVSTMIMRSCVDSALLANFPAFIELKGPGSRQTNTVLRPGPGEVVTREGGGAQKIQDVLMKMPYSPPSAEAMALGSKVEDDAKRLAGVLDIPVGEGRIGNTPVGTIMSYIESVSQVPGAVHKDDHISQQDEYEMLRELIAEEPEVLARGNRSPARKWQISEEVMAPDLTPAADPNTPSQIHRLMKVQGLIMLGGLPQFAGIADNRAIYKHAARILAGANSNEFEMPPKPPAPPPPDPRIIAAQIKAQSDTTKAQAQQQSEAQKHDERMAEIASENEQRAADRDSAETRAAMGVETAKIKATADTANAEADRLHDTANQAADRTQDHAHHIDQQHAAAAAALAPQPQPEGTE